MIYRFETTPRMSTYLVAYVIGYYDLIEKRDANGVIIRVYTPIGKKEQGVFALEVNFSFSRGDSRGLSNDLDCSENPSVLCGIFRN